MGKRASTLTPEGKGRGGDCTEERLDCGEAPAEFSAIPWGDLELTMPCRDVPNGISGHGRLLCDQPLDTDCPGNVEFLSEGRGQALEGTQL